MINKKLAWFLVSILILTWLCSTTNATEIRILPKVETASWSIIVDIKKDNRDIKRRDFFIFLANQFRADIKDSYKYINLNFVDVWYDKDLKEALQILVYVDFINNSKVKIYPLKTLDTSTYYTFIQKKFNIDTLPSDESIDYIKSRNTKQYDLTYTQKIINAINEQIATEQAISEELNEKIIEKQQIFNDVYNTILNTHYDKSKFDKLKLYESAINWLAEWTNDKYTTYMPSNEKQNFDDNLNWQFEWIGAYIEMEEAWVLKIIAPISWSPAEKAWLKWWDQILSADWNEITQEISVNEATSWIKWTIWTSVKLKIKRWDQILDFEIKREKITVKEVEYKLVNQSSYLIEIKTFWASVDTEFKEAIEKIKTDSNIKNIIIDLRNNPWWYLDQVNKILWYFIEQDKTVSIIRYSDSEEIFTSNWENLLDLSKYKLIIIQNKWTASASEIMIWSLKDYFPNTITVWETSYGKWSVQTVRTYSDWSALKYTIAKWFTWKNNINIDWTWFKPDIEVIQDDPEHDNVMQKVSELIK